MFNCEQGLSYICCLEIKLLKVCFKSIFGDLKLHNFHIVVFFWNVSFYVILREL
jgi:hypothetical protein